MYFPFVSAETREILKSVMEAAHNYNDFVVRLVEWVCKEVSSEDLVLLAAIHSRNLSDSRIYDLLREKHYHTLLVRPFLLTTDAQIEEQPQNYESAKVAIELVLETQPQDWVRFCMHRLGVGIGEQTTGDDFYGKHALDKMEHLLENNKTLSCFQQFVTRVKAWDYHSRDYEEATRITEQAYKQAMDVDDKVTAAEALTGIAHYMRNYDRQMALKYLAKAEGIIYDLDVHRLKDYSIGVRGSIHNARGEYNAVIDGIKEKIRLAEKIGALSMGFKPRNMAFLLNEIGENEEAFEWAKMAIDTVKGYPFLDFVPFFDAARALIGLGRLKEANQYIAEAKKGVLKTGMDLFLMVQYYIEGLLELEEGLPVEAMQSFERSLRICERIGRRNRMNSILIALVECEIVQFIPNQDNRLNVYSGPWMERLERDVEEEDIPGIEGRLLLLKAKLRLKQGRKNDAEMLFSEIRRLAENPHVRYLADRVAELRAQARLLES